MADTLRCPYCDSTQLVPFHVKYYKCQECGHIVITPVIVSDAVKPETATE